MGVPSLDIEDPENLQMDFSKISQENINRIRALYLTDLISEDEIATAASRSTIFDGQHVMVVDEVRSSGRTLEVAQKLLSMAVPEATFTGHYWAKPPKRYHGPATKLNNNKMQFNIAWVPMWYKPDEPTGRGVGNRNPSWPEKASDAGIQVSEKAKIGRYILSTPPHNTDTYQREKDETSFMYRHDFKQLARDLNDKKVLYIPSLERSEEEQDSRIEKLNNLSLKEFVTKKRELDNSPSTK